MDLSWENFQPGWDKRLFSHKHEHWFRNLVHFHELTCSWLKELKIERPSHFISRGVPADAAESLLMLESLQETQIDWLLDDTQPDDTLGRLEHTVWVTQAWALKDVFSKADEKKRAALSGIFEQSAWKLGRQYSANKWSNIKNKLGSNLKTLVPLLSTTPFCGFPKKNPFLIKRAIDQELIIELNHCPHRSEIREVLSEADELCLIHTQWLRGFVYELENSITVESSHSKPRCTLRWFFAV
jgi:hypothetical protein